MKKLGHFLGYLFCLRNRRDLDPGVREELVFLVRSSAVVRLHADLVLFVLR